MSRSIGIACAVVAITLVFVFVVPELDSGGAPATAVALGERAESVRILDEAGVPRFRALESGRKATVIWFWSVKCACVRDCESRIRTLLDRYKGLNVAFIAIDGNPDDTREEIEALRRKLGSTYEVLRDDDGATVRQFGIKASASVAVLDGDLRLRFRGAIDDDRYNPTVSFVHRAVDAILARKEFKPTHARPYGCLYPVPQE